LDGGGDRPFIAARQQRNEGGRLGAARRGRVGPGVASGAARPEPAMAGAGGARAHGAGEDG
jgi:hypothetical protein